MVRADTHNKIVDIIWSTAERMQADIAREVRVLLGEDQYDQRMFTAEDTARRVKALQKCAIEQTTDAERHESWMKMHFESGWTYGPELIPSEKKHPNLLPWDQLPANTRSKARIFDMVAKHTLAAIRAITVHTCPCAAAEPSPSGEAQ
jgi:hypothetical protein